MVGSAGLSLLVTCFNSEGQMGPFLAWLRAHVELFDEVILVDDCSVDSTPNLLIEASKKIDRIKLILRSENSGRPSIPRNQAIEKAGYSRIVFMDVDDLLPTEYVKFLRAKGLAGAREVYSGTKLAIDVAGFNYEYPCDFSKHRKLSSKSLRFKNQMVFSGSSIPSRLAKLYSFHNCPLEDWLYWIEVSAGDQWGGGVRLLDVPIAYNCEITLSPQKSKQIRRVNKLLPALGLVAYAFIFVRMKFEESRLMSRYKSVS